IRSENGSDSTTVTASNANDHVFYVTANYVNISGFTVEGAKSSMGVRLFNANYCNVSDINASDNYYGIYLESSNNNTLTGNTVRDNGDGIILGHSSYNTLTGNNVSNNNNGIWLTSSNYNTLTGNTVSSNNGYGIYLYSSSYNTLTGNTVSNNGYGIWLDSSSNNLIYNNYFKNPINAYDDGTNIWSITKTPETNIIGGPYLGGNYWSDYVDADEDGLGDTWVPYDSSGDIKNGGDSLPLVAAITIKGDVNGDGEVTLFDAMYLAKHVLGEAGYEVLY
ncbi:MAG: NosD domain-containing protein, partial [Halobacteriota archaeon]|nr:NosD domain-containing protein [Halobacteriota archaeon]